MLTIFGKKGLNLGTLFNVTTYICTHECALVQCALSVYDVIYNTDIITIFYWIIDTTSSNKYHQEYGIKNVFYIG